MDSMHYDERLAPRFWNHNWHTLITLRRCLEETLDRHALLQPGQLIVDIGCGDRPYEPIFRSGGCEYLGCDLGVGAEVRFEPGLPIPLPEASADGVVSFQVLEHVWDLDWYLGECRRLLKPGGWLLLSTHGTWLYHPHPADFRRWTRDGLIGELTTRGFQVQAVEPAVGPLAWTTQFRLLGMREVLRRIPVLGRALLVPLICAMNVRMLIEDAITPASIRNTDACVYITVASPRGC